MYQHILATIEVHDHGRRVLEHAQSLAGTFDAKLSVLHVVEYLPVDPAADALLTTPIDLSQERAQEAQRRLQDWCRDLGIGTENARVAVGSITGEILRARDELGADLIVIGHHARHGLGALFSHTDDGVLARSSCDLLAVNLNPDD